MTYKLTATITHKGWDGPVIKELYFHGIDFNSILDQIETLPQHIYNLKHYKKTAFKDARGVKHNWKLSEVMTDAVS